MNKKLMILTAGLVVGFGISGQNAYAATIDSITTSDTDIIIQQTKTKCITVGSTGDVIKSIQKVLNFVGNYNLSTDGIFGESTFNAIQTFQIQNNLVPDGIIGQKTAEALSKSATKTGQDSFQQVANENLQNTIKKEQQILVDLGYEASSIKNFQLDNGLVADGIVGPKTKLALYRAKHISELNSGKITSDTNYAVVIDNEVHKAFIFYNEIGWSQLGTVDIDETVSNLGFSHIGLKGKQLKANGGVVKYFTQIGSTFICSPTYDDNENVVEGHKNGIQVSLEDAKYIHDIVPQGTSVTIY